MYSNQTKGTKRGKKGQNIIGIKSGKKWEKVGKSGKL